MLVSRIVSRVSKSVSRRSILSVAAPSKNKAPILSNEFHSVGYVIPSKHVASQVSVFNQSPLSSAAFHWFGYSSSASSEPNERENTDTSKANEASDEKENLAGKKATEHSKESDSESDSEDLSRDDLVKLVTEKEELLKTKNKELEQMQDKVLRAYAEMENVMDRTKREAENSKKFAIQNFAKSLLDVADNLERASSVVKESYSKIDTSKDAAGAVPLLKTLLDGVEMTEKQLGQAFKKFGVEKYNPLNEPFDPNRHNAMFQVPDASKPDGTIAHVLKPGYMLYDRVIRPAEVGVTQAEATGEV